MPQMGWIKYRGCDSERTEWVLIFLITLRCFGRELARRCWYVQMNLLSRKSDRRLMITLAEIIVGYWDAPSRCVTQMHGGSPVRTGHFSSSSDSREKMNILFNLSDEKRRDEDFVAFSEHTVCITFDRCVGRACWLDIRAWSVNN